jgi:hypothetical protein
VSSANDDFFSRSCDVMRKEGLTVHGIGMNSNADCSDQKRNMVCEESRLFGQSSSFTWDGE